MAQRVKIWSLARELTYVAGMAKRKKRKELGKKEKVKRISSMRWRCWSDGTYSVNRVIRAGQIENWEEILGQEVREGPEGRKNYNQGQYAPHVFQDTRAGLQGEGSAAPAGPWWTLTLTLNEMGRYCRRATQSNLTFSKDFSGCWLRLIYIGQRWKEVSYWAEKCRRGRQ